MEKDKESSETKLTSEPVPAATPVEAEKKPVPPQNNDVVQEGQNNILSVSLDVKPMPLFAVTNKFKSNIVVKITNRKKVTYMEYAIKIGDFDDPESYVQAREKLALRLMTEFDYLVVDVPDMVEPMRRMERITMPSAIGYDANQLIGSVKRADLVNLSAWMLTLANGDSNVEVDDRVMVALDFERELTRQYHAINQEYLRDIDEWREFCRNLEDEFYYIAPKDPAEDPRFVKMAVDGRYGCYDYMLRNNVSLWQAMSQMMRTKIMASVTFQIKQESDGWKRVVQALAINQGIINPARDTPGEFSSAKGRDFIYNYISTLFMGQFKRMSYELEYEVFNLAVLLDCVLLKLLVPKWLMHPRSVIKIDNYINRHLMTKIRRGLQYAQTNLEAETVNHLSVNLQNIGALGDYAPFLLTTEQGHGWASAGARVNVTIEASRYHPRNILFWSPIGYLQEEELDHYPQLQNFTGFYNALVALGDIRLNVYSNRDAGRQFMAMLSLVYSIRDTISTSFYTMQRMLRRMMLTSVSSPITDDAHLGVHEHEYVTEAISTMAPYAYIALIEPRTFTINDFGLDLVRWGYDLNNWFNRFTEGYQYAVETMPRPRFTKSERLDAALLHAGSVGAGRLVHSILREAPNRHMLEMPPNEVLDYRASIFRRKVEIARRAVDNNKRLFGFTDHFYYARNPEFLVPPAEFQKLYVVEGANPDETIDYNTLLERLVRLTFNRWMQGTMENNTLVRFDIPVRVEVRDALPNGREVPFNTILKSGDRLTLKPLTVYYRWDDEEYINPDANELAFMEPPQFVVTGADLPFTLDAVHHITNNMLENLVVRRSGFRLDDTITFIRKMS